MKIADDVILCQTCKEEKPISDIRCKGTGIHPALCLACFRKKKNAYMKAYYQRPEVNKERKKYAKERAQIPSVNKQLRVYAKKYRERPDVKKRRTDWLSEYIEQPGKRNLRNGYNRKYYNKIEVKEKKREYGRKPEVKEKKREYGKRPEVKERMNRINHVDIENVRDRYVKYLIRQKTGRILSAKDIPRELIEIQRQSLILKRTIKQKQ